MKMRQRAGLYKRAPITRLRARQQQLEKDLRASGAALEMLNENDRLLRTQIERLKEPFRRLQRMLPRFSLAFEPERIKAEGANRYYQFAVVHQPIDVHETYAMLETVDGVMFSPSAESDLLNNCLHARVEAGPHGAQYTISRKALLSMSEEFLVYLIHREIAPDIARLLVRQFKGSHDGH